MFHKGRVIFEDSRERKLRSFAEVFWTRDAIDCSFERNWDVIKDIYLTWFLNIRLCSCRTVTRLILWKNSSLVLNSSRNTREDDRPTDWEYLNEFCVVLFCFVFFDIEVILNISMISYIPSDNPSFHKHPHFVSWFVSLSMFEKCTKSSHVLEIPSCKTDRTILDNNISHSVWIFASINQYSMISQSIQSKLVVKTSVQNSLNY
jgi:hypothetical protein